MGNQGGGTGRGGPEEDCRELQAYLNRVSMLLANPEQLQQECEYQFDRAGPNALGELRRLELRRLLHTFARSLGSTELTWEAIEATAVIGTVEPQVPVVKRDEFFRCALKTLHLVYAELNAKLEKAVTANTSLSHQVALQASAAQRFPRNEADASSSSSTARSEASQEDLSGAEDAQALRGDSASASARGATLALGSPPRTTAPPRLEGEQCDDRGVLFTEGEPYDDPGVLFAPAGGVAEAVAPVDGMVVYVLNASGSFDAQRLYVDQGMMVLSAPEQESSKPGWASRLFGDDGRAAFDLSLAEAILTAQEAWNTPIAALVPGFAAHARSHLDRMLLLAFSQGEVLCLLFHCADDCDRCLGAVQREARAAGAELIAGPGHEEVGGIPGEPEYIFNPAA